MENLQNLIRSLQGLYTQIASRLLDDRLRTKPVSAGPRESVPIRDLLADHIAKSTPAREPTHLADADDPPAPVTEPTAGETSPATDVESHERSGLGVLGALSKHFSGHRRASSMEPYMREKMRTNTLEHINKALTLARRGHTEGASIHAELAESAMKTAAEYMSDDEYRLLREEVQSRLASKTNPASQDSVPGQA